MHKKSIVHVITKSRMKSEAFSAEIDAMEELSEKYWIKNVLYYKWEHIEYRDLIERLAKFWILLYNYSNKEDLKDQVSKLNKEYEVVFVYTPMELLINTVNELKLSLGHPLSDDPTIFRDKYLQRSLIQEHNPELGIKFLRWLPEDLDIQEIEDHVWYPFIIKPVDGLQSSWVAKVTNREQFEEYLDEFNNLYNILKSRWLDDRTLIVEEFIDGTFYSVDYFVSSDGSDVTMSRPMKVKLGIDVGINDYCNIDALVTQKTQSWFRGKNLKAYVKQIVKATGIKSTFVHHEFKINSNGEFKTIELNGRIGGKRVELIKTAYDVNLYEFIISPDLDMAPLKENTIVFFMYAHKRWILKSFHEKIFKKIENRESVFDINYETSFLGKEIWLTRDWFVNVGHIRLKNKDYKQLRKDYLYIKSHYTKLLDIQ